jgi:SAM-dependent methyltransferase
MNTSSAASGKSTDVDSFAYVGSELHVFSRAAKWKNYYRALIDLYIGREVLEVGAGIGATTESLCKGRVCDRWVCLEPDAALGSSIANLIKEGRLPSFCEVKIGVVQNLAETESFDTILYIDVLEHIKDDAQEIRGAEQRLKPGGYLIVLSPAHQALYSPFDASIGHYRRYDKQSLEKAIPTTFRRRKLLYVDAVGMLASLGNKIILKSGSPKQSQIDFWDRVMIPASRFIDPLLRFRVGKTIIGVWEKSAVSNS